MIFNLMMLVMFATVAYFQYTQGLFSATLSAIICMIAAVVAVSYHESITPLLMKLPEQANAVALVVLFAATFMVLRLIFDSAVPGNVRFPLLMDKIGAAVMGIVTGLFSSGVLALAAQSLPFGPSIGGYSRQDLQDRPNVTILGANTGNGRPIDTFITDEMVGDRLGDPNRLDHLWFHQDDLVLGFTRLLSDGGGSLSNAQPLEQAHPDYLTELFGQRLGSPVGYRRVAVSSIKTSNVKVDAAWALDKAPIPNMTMDAEIPVVRGDLSLPEIPTPGSSTALVVLRVQFSPSTDVTDTDGLLRISPSNVRLKAGATDYYPVGTLVGGALLMKNRADDPMVINLVKGEESVDFLFVIDADNDLKRDEKDKSLRFKSGSFLEIKRYAMVELNGTDITTQPPRFSVESAADFESNSILGGVTRKREVGEKALEKLTAVPQKPASKEKPQSSSRTPGTNQPTAPSGSKQDNEFLPPTPGQGMGL